MHRDFHRPRAGFTLVELLVVILVIVILLGLLIPALAGAFKSGAMTGSMNNLRQISTMLTQYAQENREHIVPSQFDYSPAQFSYKGHVRSEPPVTGNQHEGTWTDILWVFGGVADLPSKYDSPDEADYVLNPELSPNPFRSTTVNTRNSGGDGTALPFGTGADEAGGPGYFAANDFFNARPDAPGTPPATGRWYTMGQLKAPDRSLYVVDSFFGEVIEPIDTAWDVDGGTAQVDFRYNDACLMLFLDGHADVETEWENLKDLELNRRIRVTDPLSN